MKLACALRCCCGLDVLVGLAIFAGIVAAAVPAMADSASARRGALAASMIALGNAQGGYTINVTLVGTGTGTVVDDLGEISCGGDCTGNYSEETLVTLTATADPGSHFAGWSGAGCAGTGDCQILITDAGASVIATFDHNPVLSMNIGGSGMGSVMSDIEGDFGFFSCTSGVTLCQGSFPPGSVVTLNPTAATGSHFRGWTSGPCTGLTGPCTITMPIDEPQLVVTCAFDADPILVMNISGSGSGSVMSDIEGDFGFFNCASGATICLQAFPPGTVLTLNPTPDPGSFFREWTSGPCMGQTGPCTITMPTDEPQLVVSCAFDHHPFIAMNIGGTGTGSVMSDIEGDFGFFNCASGATICLAPFPPGSVVTLIPTPDPGNWFDGWTSGPCSGTEPCAVTMPQSDETVLVTASFRQNTAPTAVCQPLVLDARAECISLDPPASAFDGGSTDPDLMFGDVLSFSVSPQGPYPPGITNVTLTVTDGAGESDTCDTTVEVLIIDCNSNGVADTCDIDAGSSLDCNENWVPDECECFWCNVSDVDFGERPPPEADVNAQLSHLGGGTPCGEKVADDFYLEPGCVHRITAVRGKLLTNSIALLRRARVELYEDCNGQPVDEPFFVADYDQENPIPSEVIDVQPAQDGYSVVTYRFDLCDEFLWLDGGKTYWVSLIGLTDNVDMVDLSYWVAGSEFAPLLGSIPVKRSGTPGATWGSCDFGPWESIEDCCIGCVNMDFCVDGYSCPILWDNGKVDLVDRGGSPSGTHRQYHDRTADSFVVKTCEDADLCFVEAWIWTNCDPVYGFIEFYYDLACGPPRLEDEAFYRFEGDQLDTERFEETVVIDGRTFNLWRLRVKDPRLTLNAAHNYWLSAGAESTGNFNSNSYFAWSKYGCEPCNGVDSFRITPGQHRTLRPPASEWAEVIPARDFAFRIAVHAPGAIPQDNDDPGIGGDPPTPPGVCIADANNNGEVAVDDIFTFLSAWFVGCP